jgi:mRNA interferase MazF
MARRGEIWLVDFGKPVGREQSGIRPAVVVSSDRLNEGRSGVLMVVPLTTTRRGLPSHIEIEPGTSGLESVSYARCEDLKSISMERLDHRQGAAEPGALFEIARVLRFLLEL